MSAFVVNIDTAPIPEIDPVVFIQQVITAISDQISQLDVEINMASQGDRGEVKALSEAVTAIKSSASQTAGILSAILADKNKLEVAIARLEGPGQTLLHLRTLIDLVKALEDEVKSDPEETFGYFAGVAELLTDVKSHMRPFEPYTSTPQLKAVTAKVAGMTQELERMVQWRVREIGPMVTTDEEDLPPLPSLPSSGGRGGGGGCAAGGAGAAAGGASSRTGGTNPSPNPNPNPTLTLKSPSSSTKLPNPPDERLVDRTITNANTNTSTSASASANLEVLQQVADIVQVLGPPFRRDLLVRFAQLQLIPYEKVCHFMLILACR